jgi:hypothetical protein
MTDSPDLEYCLTLGAIEVYAGDECAGLRVAGWKRTKKLRSVFLLAVENLHTSIYSCSLLKCNFLLAAACFGQKWPSISNGSLMNMFLSYVGVVPFVVLYSLNGILLQALLVYIFARAIFLLFVHASRNV